MAITITGLIGYGQFYKDGVPVFRLPVFSATGSTGNNASSTFSTDLSQFNAVYTPNSAIIAASAKWTGVSSGSPPPNGTPSTSKTGSSASITSYYNIPSGSPERAIFSKTNSAGNEIGSGYTVGVNGYPIIIKHASYAYQIGSVNASLVGGAMNNTTTTRNVAVKLDIFDKAEDTKMTNFYLADFSGEYPVEREQPIKLERLQSTELRFCAVYEDGTFGEWTGEVGYDAYVGDGSFSTNGRQITILEDARSPKITILFRPVYDNKDGDQYATVNVEVLNPLNPYDPYGQGGYGQQTNPVSPGSPQIPGGSGGVPSGPSGGEWGNALGGTSNPGLAAVQSTDTGLFRVYSMTLAEIQALGRELWSASILDTISKYFENPADLIMGILEYPFNIQAGVSEPIVFNWLPANISTFDVTGSRLANEYVTLDFGMVEIPRVSGTYYDFQPYTTAEVYLPYIGFVPIKYSEVVGGTLSLRYNVSLTSGAGVAILSSSKLGVIGTFNCIIGRQLPVTTRDFSSTYISIAKAGISGVAAIAGAGMSAGASIASSAFMLDPTNFYRPNALSTINTLGTMANVGGQMASHGSRSFGQSAINSVSNANGHITRSGSFDSASGRCSNQNAFVVVSAPHQNLPAAYGKTLGYPCNIGGLLGQFSGYTEVRSINVVAIGASSAELSEIENILKGGIII